MTERKETPLLQLPNKAGRALLAAVLLVAAPAALAEPMVLFSGGDLAGWEVQVFDKVPRPTEYEVVEDPDAEPAGPVLEGVADGGGSGYIMERKLPFSADAVLEIDYKVLEASNPADEQTKAGDDYPLRIYLSSRNLLVYQTLMLVHSIQHPAGATWPSPYSGSLAQFEIHAIGGSGDEIGQWRRVEVPVGRLWEQTYGDAPDALIGIAFMVDSDNAGGFMRTRIARLAYRP